MGDGDRPCAPGIGELTRRIGDGALLILGLALGDKFKLSSWLLVGITIGGALKRLGFIPSFGRVLFLGLPTGDVAGVECLEPGVSVSQLVAALKGLMGLGGPVEGTNVSDDTVRYASDGTFK